MNFDQIQIQKSFADQLSGILPLFTKKSDSPYLANFRCVLCGDSQKNVYKKRGYLLSKGGGPIQYACHNCHRMMSLGRFLKEHEPALYQKYAFDMLQTRQTREKPKPQEVKPVGSPYIYKPDQHKHLIPITMLPRDHKCIQYLRSRMLPPDKCKQLYYCERFYRYVNSVLPDKIKEHAVKNHEHDRLILPLKTREGVLFGVNARAFDADQTRYLTIKFDESEQKVFGLDSVNFNKYIYIHEGPLDSLFIDNSIAITGTDVDINLILRDKSRGTIVLDNQPRNKDVVKKYGKYIANGNRVVIWPANISEKDINDMVLYADMSPEQIKTIIDEHTYQGMLATIQFNNWRKV